MHCFPDPHIAVGFNGSHVNEPPPELVVDVELELEEPQIQESYPLPSGRHSCAPKQAPGPLHNSVVPGIQTIPVATVVLFEPVVDIVDVSATVSPTVSAVESVETWLSPPSLDAP